jgi:hypothetical protein
MFSLNVMAQVPVERLVQMAVILEGCIAGASRP